MKLTVLMLASLLIVSNSFADATAKKTRKPSSNPFTGTCKFADASQGITGLTSSNSTTITELSDDSVTISNNLPTDSIDYGQASGTYARLIGTSSKNKGQPVVVVGMKRITGPDGKPHLTPDGHTYYEYDGGTGDGSIFILVENKLVNGGKSGIVKWRENGGDGGDWDTVFDCAQ